MNVELEYQKMVDWYDGSRNKKNATGKESVLRAMLENPSKMWWWSWEFIGRVTSKGDFLSHRAPARASDLAIHHPELVEDRSVGRFKVYRLRWENVDKVKEFLGESTATPSPQLTKTVVEHVMVNGVRVAKLRQVPV